MQRIIYVLKQLVAGQPLSLLALSLNTQIGDVTLDLLILVDHKISVHYHHN